jgi:hypothetical protein
MNYRSAIDETAMTIRLRARLYRNLVVIVVLTGITITVLAMALSSWRVFSVAVCVVPVCGLFLIRDGQLVGRWRSSLLTAWANRNLDFVALSVALRALPALPRGTLEGMWATLPSAPSLAAEQELSAATRRAIAAQFDASRREQMNALITRVVGCALLVATAFATACDGLWALAALPIACCGIVGGEWAMRLFRLRRRVGQMAACRAEPTFNEDAYRRAVAQLQRGNLNE